MSQLFPYLLGFLAVVCYAALTPLAKKLQLDLSPWAFMVVTTGFLAALSAVAFLVFEKAPAFPSLPLSTWLGFLLFSLINLAGFFLYLTAIAKMPAVEYTLIGLATPVITALIASVLLGESFTWRHAAGLCLIALGVFVAISGSLPRKSEVAIPSSQVPLNKAS